MTTAQTHISAAELLTRPSEENFELVDGELLPGFRRPVAALFEA